ncbi:MAG: hypothetical protein PHO42_00235 [Candidatus Omnitrophica bacterium]|nr:hypothetical protein [Candidatus Omnitrophota bacterium]
MTGCKKALIISEVGWRGAKELSSALLKNNLSVDIIIKGTVNKRVLGVITRPDGLRIHAIPRIFFNPYLFFYFLWHRILEGLETVIVTKEQTRKWVRGFGLDAKILIETEKGYEIRNNRE